MGFRVVLAGVFGVLLGVAGAMLWPREGAPPQAPVAAASGPTRIAFEEVAEDVGIGTVCRVGVEGAGGDVRDSGSKTDYPCFHLPDGYTGVWAELMAAGIPPVFGTGLCAGDVDNDGDDDLYVVAQGPPEAEPVNRLFRNDGGERFVDITDASGVGDTGWGKGCLFFDAQGDGALDLYVTNRGANVLYLNRGDGTFEKTPNAGGAEEPGASASAAAADVDLDGDLDLFVANSTTYEPMDRLPADAYPWGMRQRRNALYLNRGDGTFEKRQDPCVIERAREMSLGAVFFDIDLDGDADLYVANDGDADSLFLNIGGGRFVNAWQRFGFLRQEAGMGIAVGDANGDLFPDLYLTHWLNETDSLMLNPGKRLGLQDLQGGGMLRDMSCEAGLTSPSLMTVAWGTAFADFDLDGDEDLVVARGHTGGGTLTEYEMPTGAFENVGDARFRDVSEASGVNDGGAYVSRGLAALDFDQDGDMDIAVANIGGPVELLRNDSERGNGLTLRLRMDGPNRFAVGALVRVTAGERTQLKQVIAGGTYLSCSTTDLIFGLGTAKEAERVLVRWPGRSEEESYGPLPAGRVHELRPRQEEGL